MARLFVGVALPTRVREELARIAAVLEPHVPGARWMRPEAYHLTLAFLGAVPGDRTAVLAGAVDEAARTTVAATTRLTEPGAFPSVRRARVVWAGLDDPDGAIAAIAASVQRALEPHGFPPERRPYHAHVTLARIAEPRALDLPAVEADPAPIRLDALTLFESHLRRDGATYEAIATASLRP